MLAVDMRPEWSCIAFNGFLVSLSGQESMAVGRMGWRLKIRRK
jgi:hypothetical protein